MTQERTVSPDVAAMVALVDKWIAELPPDDAAKHARVVGRLRASLAQSPAPAKPESDAHRDAASDLAIILGMLTPDQGYEDAPWRAGAIRLVRNHIRECIVALEPRRAGDAMVQPEPQRPGERDDIRGVAPAWTREAPKEPGRYWMRDGETVEVVEVDVGFDDGPWLDRVGYDCAVRAPSGAEFWPVPIPEPPK